MEEPLGELRRQRELIAAHLRFLDDQIARKSGQTPDQKQEEATVAPDPAQSPPEAEDVAETAGSQPDVEVPEIDPASVRAEVRRGCMIYVAIATVLCVAALGFAYWMSSR